MKRQDSANVSEDRCHLLGDLAARAAEERPPDRQQWAEIAQALARGPGFLWRRRLVLVFPALALLGLALWIAAGRTLGYQLQGCSLAPDGSLSVPDDREGTVAFDDGTRMTLGKATSGRVRALGFRRGARLALRSGHVDLSVVHRLVGRWEVLAGPFEVRVTGTRFEVDWASGQGLFSLRVSQGEVSVSGGPLRDHTPVRAGQRLEVDTTTARVVVGDFGAGAQATAVQAVPAEILEETAAEEDAIPTPAIRAERKRGAPSSKSVMRNPPPVAKAESPAATAELPAPKAEPPAAAPPAAAPPAAAPEPVPRDRTASSAAEDRPLAAPGPRRLTIGENGKLAGDDAGSAWAAGGVGTTFSAPANASPDHLYLDDGLLCTHGRISALACVDVTPVQRCDWATNWGVLLGWNPRADRKGWGSRAASGIAMEFRGKSGRYRLVAHREGDPAQKVYCIENYRSGRTVTPSEFKSECWTAGGSSLPDFTKIDFFALQFPSAETLLRFRLCLSAIGLH